jgi:hypothetical protein
MGDWKPEKEQTLPDDRESPFSRRFYLWIIPERK